MLPIEDVDIKIMFGAEIEIHLKIHSNLEVHTEIQNYVTYMLYSIRAM